MKKTLILSGMVLSLSFSALAQGNFTFFAPASYVWNQETQTRGGNFNAAFLWNSGGSTASLLGNATTGSPTNSVTAVSGSWASILNDPNWTVATVSGSGTVAVGTVSSAGGISFNGGSPFLVTGTSAAGATVGVYMIAWDNQYATPAAASGANALVGYSRIFSYTYANSSSAPASSLGQAATLQGTPAQFGTRLSPVPEPATFALAGLGMAAMLVARRRK